MHHQQELQLNNPKIDSDKQLLENIIIISLAYFWQIFVKEEVDLGWIFLAMTTGEQQASEEQNLKKAECYESCDPNVLSPSCSSALSKGPAATEEPPMSGAHDGPQPWSQPGLRGLAPRQHSRHETWTSQPGAPRQNRNYTRQRKQAEHAKILFWHRLVLEFMEKMKESWIKCTIISKLFGVKAPL